MDNIKDYVLHSKNGKFTEGTSTLVDVTRIMDLAQKADPENGLVLHFHGGLVDENSGRNIAAFLAPNYLEAKAYPVFFVWESGFLETIKNNLPDIQKDPAFRELTKKVGEWVLKKIGGQVGLKGTPGQAIDENEYRKEFDLWFEGQSPDPPVTDEVRVAPTAGFKSAAGLNEDDLAVDIEAGLDSDPDFQNAIQELYNAHIGAATPTRGGGSTVVAENVLVDERALREMFPESEPGTKGLLTWLAVAKFVSKVVIAIIKRNAKGRAHGMYCTIVEEVLRAAYVDKAGATIWNQMKKDTLDAFGTEDTCCGAAVIRELAKKQASGMAFHKITLVGHSTGAVYICHFLDAVAKVLQVQKFDVIFLAPAVRHDLFAKAIEVHGGRIDGFRIFGMTDALESADVLVPRLYTRSLLYFVSGLLEGHREGMAWKDDVDVPVLGMQRYIVEDPSFASDEFPEIATVRKFLLGRIQSAVWSESSLGNGLNSKSHKHGDFDNDDDTVRSFCWIIENGF